MLAPFDKHLRRNTKKNHPTPVRVIHLLGWLVSNDKAWYVDKAGEESRGNVN